MQLLIQDDSGGKRSPVDPLAVEIRGGNGDALLVFLAIKHSPIASSAKFPTLFARIFGSFFDTRAVH